MNFGWGYIPRSRNGCIDYGGVQGMCTNKTRRSERKGSGILERYEFRAAKVIIDAIENAERGNKTCVDQRLECFFQLLLTNQLNGPFLGTF